MTLLAVILQVAGQTPVPLQPTAIPQWADAITLSTVVVAVFTVVNVLVTALMWNATRRQANLTQSIFEAAHRPYIGVLTFSGSMNHTGGDIECWMSITAKNAGEVPAFKVLAEWELSTGGAILSHEPMDKAALVMLPDEPQQFGINYLLSRTQYDSLVEGSVLNVCVRIRYKGVTEKDYTYTQFGKLHLKDHRGYVMTEADSN